MLIFRMNFALSVADCTALQKALAEVQARSSAVRAGRGLRDTALVITARAVVVRRVLMCPAVALSAACCGAEPVITQQNASKTSRQNG